MPRPDAQQITFDDVRGRAAGDLGHGRPHPDDAQPNPQQHSGRRRVGEVREPPVHVELQGSGGAATDCSSSRPTSAARGVIAMSAGNHAQGVAYHATRLGIPATIVMPRYTPNVKVAGTEALGARVVLHGADIDRGQGRGRGAGRRRGPGVGAAVRRPGDHRRPGHDGHRDARGRSGPRHARRAGRRRRPDRGDGHRGRRRCDPTWRSSASRPSCTRRWWPRSTAVPPRFRAVRRWPRASPCRCRRADDPDRRAAVADDPDRARVHHRARHEPLPRHREDGGRRGRGRRPRRRARAPGAFPGPPGRASC